MDPPTSSFGNDGASFSPGTGVIVGIVIGCVVALSLVGTLFCNFVKKRRRRRRWRRRREEGLPLSDAKKLDDDSDGNDGNDDAQQIEGEAGHIVAKNDEVDCVENLELVTDAKNYAEFERERAIKKLSPSLLASPIVRSRLRHGEKGRFRLKIPLFGLPSSASTSDCRFRLWHNPCGPDESARWRPEDDVSVRVDESAMTAHVDVTSLCDYCVEFIGENFQESMLVFPYFVKFDEDRLDCFLIFIRPCFSESEIQEHILRLCTSIGGQHFQFAGRLHSVTVTNCRVVVSCSVENDDALCIKRSVEELSIRQVKDVLDSETPFASRAVRFGFKLKRSHKSVCFQFNFWKDVPHVEKHSPHVMNEPLCERPLIVCYPVLTPPSSADQSSCAVPQFVRGTLLKECIGKIQWNDFPLLKDIWRRLAQEEGLPADAIAHKESEARLKSILLHVINTSRARMSLEKFAANIHRRGHTKAAREIESKVGFFDKSYYGELLEMGQDAFAVPEFPREPLSAELLVPRDARRALPVERFARLSRTDNSDVDQIAPLFNCDLIIFITDDDLISVVDQDFQ